MSSIYFNSAPEYQQRLEELHTQIGGLHTQIKRLCAECLINSSQFTRAYSQATIALDAMQVIQKEAEKIAEVAERTRKKAEVINVEKPLSQIQDVLTKASACVQLLPDLKEEGQTKEEQKESANSGALGPSCSVLIKQEGSHQLEIYAKESRTIFQVAIRFFKNDDSSLLTDAISALTELRKKRVAIKTAGNNRTEIDRVITKCNAVVQMMNFESPVATQQDVNNVLSFFNPPQQEVYYDRKNGVKYIQADYSQITRIIAAAAIDGEYTGMGMLMHQILPHPVTRVLTVCDIVTLQKKTDQIYFETQARDPYQRSIRGSVGNMFYNHAQRISFQRQAADRVKVIVRQNLNAWKYASYDSADLEKLVEIYKYSFKVAVKVHAIILFYRPLK